jgi:hypothetical protein
VKKTIMASALLTVGAVSSPAGGMDGNELLKTCQGTEFEAFCVGYITGVAGGVLKPSIDQFRLCPPHGVSGQQTKDIVVQFLVANPALRHLNDAWLVARGMENAFPCKP